MAQTATESEIGTIVRRSGSSLNETTSLPGGPIDSVGLEAKDQRTRPGIATIALVGWWLAVLVFGSLLVARSFGLPAFGEAFPRAWAYSSPVGALVLVSCGSLVGLAVAHVSPANTFRALIASGTVVLVIASIALGNTRALLVAGAISLLAWIVGDAASNVAKVRTRSSLANCAIAMALGYTVLGSAAFFLALAGGLTHLGVMVVGSVLAGISLFRLVGSRQPLSKICGVTTPLTALDALSVGASTGAATFALLSALTPENMFDPFRQHLPIAVEFWRRGSLEAIPHLVVSRDPILGHVLFTIGFGFGGVSAATLIHASMAVIATLAVAGGASLIAGQRAAIYSGVTFASMPLVLFEIGHAYTDLFPAAFAAAATICILDWIAHRRIALLVVAGVLCGAGIAAKLTTVWVSLALAVVILIAGSTRVTFRGRIVGLLVFSAGHLIAIPWIIRTVIASEGLPGKVTLVLGFLLDRVPVISGMVAPQADPGFQPVDVTNAGMGHETWNIITVPWLMAFHSDSFPDTTLGGGDVGLLLPLLLPAALLVRRDRKWWALAIASLVMYLSWWITPQQVSRHLLPTLAILAMLCGPGAARIAETAAQWPTIGRLTVRGVFVACLVGSIALFANGRFSQVPVSLVVGQISVEEYIDREIPAARELRVASATLPPSAPLVYVGRRGGAQLYSEARLVNAGQFTQELVDEQFGETDTAILAKLDSLGVTGIIWDRQVTKPEDWSSHLLSLEFLSRHTRVLAASDGYLLFALTPDAERYWNVDPETTLVLDPTFETIKRKMSPWRSEQRISRIDGVVAPRRNSAVRQVVRVAPGTPYLMVANVSCPDLWSRTALTLRWLDDGGNELSSTSQTLFANRQLDDEFLWAMAPDGAVSASIEFGGQSRCEFSRVDLFAQPTAK